jgi:PAS domain S-box-containing protein
LVETSRTLEAVIEAVPVPVIALDEDGAVDLWNRAAERTFGWSAEEVIGDPLPILPDDVGFDSTLDPMLAGEVVRGERVVRETADGERRHFRLFNAPRHDADGSVGGAIGALLDVTEQREYRERLDALHETARDLMHAESHEAVARVASDALAETLGHSLNAVRFADEERGLLEVVAVNESALGAAETRPDYDIDDTPAGEAYREERPVRSTVDPTESDHIVSAHRLYVPIPGYGVLGIGSGEEPPTDAESDLAEVLAANVEAALNRLEREAELTRQNERLEEFASVVSHDLRAPLNVAQGRLSMAAGATDDDEAQLDAVADAHDRMERLIEGLLTLARDGGAVDDRERVDVGAVAEDVWATVDAAGATLTVEDPGTVEAAPDRFRQLLGNLLRNAAEHGVADGTANGDSGSTVRVGGLDDGAGFFVADDGSGLTDPERAFEWGYTTEGSGTGLGLAIVRELSEAHGWSVVADGDGEASGARIEIRTD